MKTFVKILVAILVVAALCGGIYLVLPETAQTFVKGNIQYRINDEAKKRVDEAKNSQIKYTYKDNGIKKIYDPGTTYGSALENKAKTTVWYYERIKNFYKINKPKIKRCKTEAGRLEYSKRMQLLEDFIFQLEKELF